MILISVAQAQLFFLALTRIMAIIINIPTLGGQSIPLQVRIALGVLLTAVLIPWQPLAAGTQSLPLLGMGMGILSELIIGTLVGFAAMLTFNAIQIAGSAMSMGSGFESGRVMNPTLGETGSPMDQLFVMISIILFLVLDGHHIVLRAIQRTFEIIPVNGAIPLSTGERLITMAAQMIAAGIQLALPVMGAILLADITLGLLARVAPQVQVFFLGMPLKIGVGLFAFGLIFAVILPSLGDFLNQIGPNMLKLIVPSGG